MGAYNALRTAWEVIRSWEFVIFALVAGSVAIAFGLALVNALHVEHRTCTVTDKDRTTVSDGNGGSHSDARIYTEDCGVLHVTDSVLSWTWSSADTYAELDPGHRYEVTTRGYRIPFLSMFPNVVDVAEVTR